MFEDTGRHLLTCLQNVPLVSSVWSLFFDSVGTIETAAESKICIWNHLNAWICQFVPSSKSSSNKKHVQSTLKIFSVQKWRRGKNRKLWHLITGGTFLAEYYDVSVFNLWPHHFIHVRYAASILSQLSYYFLYPKMCLWGHKHWPTSDQFILSHSGRLHLPHEILCSPECVVRMNNHTTETDC